MVPTTTEGRRGRAAAGQPWLPFTFVLPSVLAQTARRRPYQAEAVALLRSHPCNKCRAHAQTRKEANQRSGHLAKTHVSMRGCLHLTRVARHKRHDKGGNAHSFAFDTLTKVYRDAVYLPQEKYRRGLMHPERSSGAPPSQAALVAPSSSLDVTNHVGNIGVMSSAATKLSDWMEQQQHHQEEYQTNGGGGTGHASATASCATPIARRSVASSSPSPAPSAPAATTEESHVDDEAIRRRLRAHLFSDKIQPGQPRTAPSMPVATASASPRRSGVQAEILSVYRSMLREVSRMQDADTRRSLSAYIRQEYDKQRDIPRKNIMKIEWRLNYGKRKLEELQAMSKHTKFTMMR